MSYFAARSPMRNPSKRASSMARPSTEPVKAAITAVTSVTVYTERILVKVGWLKLHDRSVGRMPICDRLFW
jgi:hypothetical protein